MRWREVEEGPWWPLLRRLTFLCAWNACASTSMHTHRHVHTCKEKKILLYTPLLKVSPPLSSPKQVVYLAWAWLKGHEGCAWVIGKCYNASSICVAAGVGEVALESVLHRPWQLYTAVSRESNFHQYSAQVWLCPGTLMQAIPKMAAHECPWAHTIPPHDK